LEGLAPLRQIERRTLQGHVVTALQGLLDGSRPFFGNENSGHTVHNRKIDTARHSTTTAVAAVRNLQNQAVVTRCTLSRYSSSHSSTKPSSTAASPMVEPAASMLHHCSKATKPLYKYTL